MKTCEVDIYQSFCASLCWIKYAIQALFLLEQKYILVFKYVESI